MRKITILLSYTTENEDERLADELYQRFQKEFVEIIPDAKLSGVHVSKEAVVVTDERLRSTISKIRDMADETSVGHVAMDPIKVLEIIKEGR
jgi:hypothetical protein